VIAVGAIALLMLGGVLLSSRQTRITSDQLQIELAEAKVRIGLLYFAQHDRPRAAAAYAEAQRIARSVSQQAQPGPESDALGAELKELEADLAAPNPK